MVLSGLWTGKLTDSIFIGAVVLLLFFVWWAVSEID